MQQTPSFAPMLLQCWPTVYDVGPALCHSNISRRDDHLVKFSVLNMLIQLRTPIDDTLALSVRGATIDVRF